MIEKILESLESTLEQIDEKFYGVTVGEVINPLDPMFLGRVQIRLPFLDSLDLSPWARIAVPMAGPFHGTYMIPNPGDQVLVAFEHGDVNAPYIIGSLWNIRSLPPLPSPLPQIRCIRTLVGNQVVFGEAPTPFVCIQNGPTAPAVIPSVPSSVGPYQTIMMSTLGTQIFASPTLQIIVGTNSILIGPDGITITSATKIDLAAAGAINITAGGTCSIKAPLVTIN